MGDKVRIPDNDEAERRMHADAALVEAVRSQVPASDDHLIVIRRAHAKRLVEMADERDALKKSLWEARSAVSWGMRLADAIESTDEHPQPDQDAHQCTVCDNIIALRISAKGVWP